VLGLPKLTRPPVAVLRSPPSPWITLPGPLAFGDLVDSEDLTRGQRPPLCWVVVCRLASRASASQLGRWLPNSGPGTAGATHRYRSGGVNGVSAIPLGVRYPRSHPPPRATRSRRWSPRRGW